MKKVRLILSSALLIATLLTLNACKKDEIKQNDNDTIKYTIPPPEFSTFTDPRDGQKYITVKIGNQWWFAQNLNYQTGNSWCYDDSQELQDFAMICCRICKMVMDMLS